MAAVKHVRLVLVLDAVVGPADNQLRCYVSRVRKGDRFVSPLRIALSDAGVVFLDGQQERIAGSAPWWPVCQIPVLSVTVEEAS